MSADLEREAREAAQADDLRARYGRTYNFMQGFQSGYLAAATLRDKEIRELQSLRGNLLTERANYETCIEERDKKIEELKTQAALLEVERNSMLVVLTDYKRSDREAYAEIASLRAKLEAVPVEEIRAVCEWELGLDFPDTAAISSWLATVTKP